MNKNRFMAEVTGLTVYPVKSMRGIDLESALLTPLGLEHDRRFMVVRSNGVFVTQRDTPLMSQIHTRLEPGEVILSRDGYGEIHVPFDRAEGKTIQTRVWNDPCETIDQGDAISLWLTEALESPERLRLVAMKPGFERPQGKTDLLGENTHTLFADAAPLLVSNEASLARLNQELRARGHQPVPMNRFRPNIVVKGLKPFAEHRLSALAGKDVSLGFCHPCERCIVTTIDQASGIKNPDREPYNTLCDINPVAGKTQKPAFGHNAVLSGEEVCQVKLGDPFEAVEITP